MIDDKSPKHHRIRKPKNTGSEDFYSDDQSFDGIIQRAKDLGRDTFIVLYSGGKDSGKVLDLLQKKDEVDGVLHLNTNTGVRVTLDFVKDECTRRGLKLYIRHPTPLAFAYVAYCLEFGFPGPKLHAAIMKILKWSSMQKFIQEPRFKKKNPALVGGVRKFESIERMGCASCPAYKGWERDQASDPTAERFGMLKQNLKKIKDFIFRGTEEPDKLEKSIKELKKFLKSSDSESLPAKSKENLIKLIKDYDPNFKTMEDYL